MRINIENLGGIDQQSLELKPGVSVLTGENATNRSSMLRAIMAACGSDRAYLKASADRGSVSLTVGDDTYTRTFERMDGGVMTDGEPLLTDENRIRAADYFAFLLADNEARLGVLNPETNLRDIVMAPVDTEAVEERIRDLQAELDSLDDDIDRRNRLQNEKLPTLQTTREELQTEIETLSQQIEETEEALEAADEDVRVSKEQKERIDSLTSELTDAREERDRIERRIESEREALEEARMEHEEIQDELDALDVPDDDERASIEKDLANLHRRREELNEKINTITTIISFNEERLSGDTSISDAVATALEESPDPTASGGRTAEDLTQQLTDPAAGDRQIRCWTCGQQANESQIEETIDALRTEVQDRRAARSDVEDDIEDLEERLNSLETRQHERRRLVRRVDSIEETIENTEVRIDSLQTQHAEAAERVERLEADVDELETDDQAHSRVVDLHSRITELETEKRQSEDELDELETEIEHVQETIAELEDVEERRARLEDELEREQRRIESIRESLVDTFNQNMDSLLENLDYENIARVWLERRREEVRKGRRKTEETVFDLHIVRETEEGTVFEDTQGIRHLSESERNVVGLVFALAGYLAHDVYEDVPFILLDSLEAIDADHISTIVDHFTQHAGYVVAALLPEDREPLLTDVEPETVVHVGSARI